MSDYCQLHPKQPAECPLCASYSRLYDQGYEEGARAARDNKRRTDNPYAHTNRDALKSGWSAGWWVTYCELNPRPPELYYKQYKGRQE